MGTCQCGMVKFLSPSLSHQPIMGVIPIWIVVLYLSIISLEMSVLDKSQQYYYTFNHDLDSLKAESNTEILLENRIQGLKIQTGESGIPNTFSVYLL